MKIGVEVKIDVKKILKERLYAGAKGTYLTMTTFIDTDNPDQYQNHGFISQSVSKEERAQGVQTPILGNCKVFWGPQESQQGGYQPQGNQGPSQGRGYQTPPGPDQGYQPQGQGSPPAPPGPVGPDDIPF